MLTYLTLVAVIFIGTESFSISSSCESLSQCQQMLAETTEQITGLHSKIKKLETSLHRQLKLCSMHSVEKIKSPSSCSPPQADISHGEMFCPHDNQSCFLECHRGFAPYGIARIQCVNGAWMPHPTLLSCVPAVALIVGSDDKTNTGVEVFTTSTNCSTDLPNLPQPRYSHTSALVDGDILTCGCSNINDDDSKRVCITMDRNTGMWRNHSRMLQPRNYHSSVVIMDKLHIIGGHGTPASSSEVLDNDVHHQWRRGKALKEKSQLSCSVKISPETFLIIGGSASLSSVWQVNMTDESSVKMENLLQPRYGHACTLMETEGGRGVLVAGGKDKLNGGKVLRSSEFYHIESGEWERVGELEMGRWGARMVVVGGERNDVVIMGGTDGINELSTVEVFKEGEWRMSSKGLKKKRNWFGVVEVPYTRIQNCQP